MHEEFIQTITFKCLLLKKTQSVLSIIEECLACVMKFSSQFLLTGEFQSTILSSVHKKFREVSSLLFKGKCT